VRPKANAGDTDARLWHPWLRINRVKSGRRSRCAARSAARRDCLQSETLTRHRRARGWTRGLALDGWRLECTARATICSWL